MKWLLLIIVLVVIAALLRARLLGRSTADPSPVVDHDDVMRQSSVVEQTAHAGEADVAGPPADDSAASGSAPQAFASMPTAANAPFGAGSAGPAEDGSGPVGHDIKGSADSMLFHPTASPYFGRINADVWFDSETSAEAAGFTRWDQRDRNAGGSSDDGDHSQAAVDVREGA